MMLVAAALEGALIAPLSDFLTSNNPRSPAFDHDREGMPADSSHSCKFWALHLTLFQGHQAAIIMFNPNDSAYKERLRLL